MSMGTKPKLIPVGPGTRITLKFALYLKDGELIDSTDNRAASCVIGDESLLPGFERAMFGMRAGQKEVFDISPEDGFGMSNPDNIHIMQAELFKEVDKKEGVVVSFADPHGLERPGVISRVLGDTLEVDFNHPLAGKELIFEVEILAVERVSDEIIRA